MNARTACLLVCLSTGLRAVEIRLLNGDRVMGEVARMEGDALVVEPRWGEGGVAVPAKYLGYLRMEPVPAPAEPFDANARVHFVNGDNLLARVLRMDSNRCELVTPWGQSLAANSRMIRRLDFLSGGGGTVLTGLGAPDDWVIARNPPSEEPRAVGGAFVIRGNTVLSRKVRPLPERLELTLLLNGRNEGYNFSFSPLLANANDRGRGSFTLQFNRSNVFNRATDMHGNVANIWNERMPDNLGTSLALRFFVDRPAESVSLYVNDHPVRSWTQPGLRESAAETERWLTLAVHNQGTLLLENLIIQAWNGVLPMQAVTQEEGGGDQILLKNGDVVQGDVLGIDGGLVRVRIPAGPTLEVPADRISAAYFSEATRHEPRRRNRDVEMRIGSRGEVLTLALAALDEDHAVGEGEMWMESLRVPRAGLSLMRFNIYQRRRHDGTEFESDWIFQSHNPQLKPGNAPGIPFQFNF